MTSSSEQPELLCPNCEYILTGLPENRCPECGEAFDPEALRLAMSGEPQPVWPCEHADRFAAPHKIWWATIRHPREFARGFPPVHAIEHAVIYSCICYAVAAVLLVLTVGLNLHRPIDQVVLITFSIVFGSLFAVWACETVIAAVLAIFLKPTRANRPYHFWRGLTHFTSGFVVLTSLCVSVCVFFLLYVFVDFSNVPGGGAYVVRTTGFMVFVWWVVSLDAMIVARSRSGPRRWIACVIVPLVGAGSVWLGHVASLFVALAAVPFM